MDVSNINFYIFAEHETFNSWLTAVLSLVKKIKREQENSAEGAREVERHKELEDSEITKIEEEKHEVNTKQNTAWATAVFKDWKRKCQQTDSYGAENLSQALRSFYPFDLLVSV